MASDTPCLELGQGIAFRYRQLFCQNAEKDGTLCSRNISTQSRPSTDQLSGYRFDMKTRPMHGVLKINDASLS